MANSTVAQAAGATPRRPARRRFWGGGLQGSDTIWAIAFLVPYVAVFLLFVVYPVGFGLWLGHRPSLYAELFSDPIYLKTVVNTLVYLAVAVNLHLFLALLLSGFFLQRGWWIKALLLLYIMPWAAPAIPTFISIHWMLNGEYGLINNILYHVFGIDYGPSWLTSRWLTFGTVIASYIWKWTPFWTVILMAGRTAIPQDVIEAAEVDGAVGIKRFIHVTFPLLANLYLICTLLSTIWTLGDFNTVFFVSGAGPALSTSVLATLGVRDAFQIGRPDLGMAAVMSALPLLIPLVIILMRQLGKSRVQL